MYFNYGEKQTEYLKSTDKKLAEVIDRVGHIYRPVNTFGEVTPKTIRDSTVEQLQLLGLTYRKAGYIKGFFEKILADWFALTQ